LSKAKIFYANGVNTGAQRGVQAIVQLDPQVSWYVESHGDYYILHENGLWRAADYSGLHTELLNRGIFAPLVGVKHQAMIGPIWVEIDEAGFHAWIDTLEWVLCGETISNDRFQEIFQEALADADFGRKNGYLPGEHRP
jgi:hypothetical protein